MRLLHLIGLFDIKAGGTYTAVISIVKLLNNLGHSNTIIATKNEGQTLDVQEDVQLQIFEKSFPKKFRASRDAKRWLEKNIQTFDAVIVHEIWGGVGLDACILSSRKGVAYHIWPHSSLDPFDLQKKKWLKIILGKIFVGKLLRNATFVCCTSKREKELLYSFGEKLTNTVTLPLPVDFYKQDEVHFPNPSRISNSLPEDAFVFLFFSRINYKKGLDNFLKAFAECLNRKIISDKSFVVIAGTGEKEYEAFIDKLIDKLNIRKKVIKLGLVTGNRKAEIYKNAHVFVLPSKMENFGLSVVESLQCNTPVLISENVYIKDELFQSQTPGWVCKTDASDLIEKIKEASCNAIAKRMEAGKAGKQFYTSEVIDKYATLFKPNCKDLKLVKPKSSFKSEI